MFDRKFDAIARYVKIYAKCKGTNDNFLIQPIRRKQLTKILLCRRNAKKWYEREITLVRAVGKLLAKITMRSLLLKRKKKSKRLFNRETLSAELSIFIAVATKILLSRLI